MPRKPLLLALFALLASCFVISSHPAAKEARPVYSGLTAHEWGTFTSIAGRDGSAVEWLPLTGSTDLPGFVEHFRYNGFKLGLRGTVRMETPVLYFYDSRQETVSVKVSFAKGLITEWYPHAAHVEPAANIFDGTLLQPHPDGSIAWDSVTISPNVTEEFPRENSGNHYYAARMTSSTPLRVQSSAGEQQEKFLFYRGVSTFSVPLSATLIPSGELYVENHGQEEIPNTIRFERRGEKVGYRIGGALQKEALLDPPELTGTIGDLGRELEGMLVAQGLYQDEAHAMVETWRGSWFEEGSRLLYIVPTAFVDGVLPLSIHPAPTQTERVFVGRLEIVTPATENAVEGALATHDSATLKMFGRFLEPILQVMIQKESNPAKAQRFNQALNTYYSKEIARNIRRD
ncbi:MAG: hypothetical protein AUH16_06940 [Acidobacteria bacterium 13_2_20CM_57_7]|nr:MAG: hypothetical protein AUH16_06940 [Acidobacteria bacterium 13_2_20CM_57_7]